uniref:Kinesin motor domain-containing protein n=1 Tax=Heterorhabditis bacteriophora TaxID=37862 RepID=A0A1I7WGA7_HETBA
MADTAGQERFHTITTSYYRGDHGIRFLETSAKANIHIDTAFYELAEAILDKVRFYTNGGKLPPYCNRKAGRRQLAERRSALLIVCLKDFTITGRDR